MKMLRMVVVEDVFNYELFTINVAIISSVLNNFVKNTKKKPLLEYFSKDELDKIYHYLKGYKNE